MGKANYYSLFLVHVIPPVSQLLESKSIGTCRVCNCDMDTAEVLCETHCGHVYHYGCFKPYLINSRHCLCPVCQEGLFNVSLGLERKVNSGVVTPAPANMQFPSSFSDDNDKWLTNNRNTFVNQFYVRVDSEMGFGSYQSLERKLVPLVMEIRDVPSITHFHSFIQWYGQRPKWVGFLSPAWFKRRQVLILPGAVDHLRGFWARVKKIPENFDLSKIRCTNYLRDINAHLNCLTETEIFAPVAAILYSPDVAQADAMVHNDYWKNMSKLITISTLGLVILFKFRRQIGFGFRVVNKARKLLNEQVEERS
jgi:hypothetical protein